MRTLTYLEFDLSIDVSHRAYRARVLRSPMGEASSKFSLPFAVDELNRIPWIAQRLSRNLRLAKGSTPATTQLDPEQLGKRLYDAVFSGNVGLCLQRSLDEARRQEKGLRIRLRLDHEAPELGVLPWEYLYATSLNRFLVLSDQTVLVRYIELEQPAQPLRIKGGLKMLAVISNPSDVRALDVEAEWERLKRALSPLEQAGRMTVERLPSATISALQARLRQGDVHLIHYIGHGYFDEAENTGGLVLEEENGQHRLVSASDLGVFLHDHAALRLLFLNACEGARNGREDAFAGLAQSLVRQSIPAVVAMQFEVSDRAAITLAQEFYKALADGYPVDAALAEARKAVLGIALGTENLYEWGTPVLFSRSPDNQLLVVPDIEEKTAQSTQVVTKIDTGGGVYVGSDATAGRDLVGRDKIIHGDEVHGDKIAGDKIINIFVTTAEPSPKPASPRIVAEIVWKSFEPKTVPIPAGEFTMGTTTASQEWRAHRLYLPDFCIGRYPITNEEYKFFVEDHPECRPQGVGWRYITPPSTKLNYPVTGISWHDAAAYCEWLSTKTERDYRLPTEAQWEKAAKGMQDSRTYPWGEELTSTFCNMQGANLTPVNHYERGVSPLGCHDMVGNIRQWTSTIWGDSPVRAQFIYPYKHDKREELAPRTTVYRIWRGGAFDDPLEYLGCATRGFYSPDGRLKNLGFRIVLQTNS